MAPRAVYWNTIENRASTYQLRIEITTFRERFIDTPLRLEPDFYCVNNDNNLQHNV